MPSTLAPIREIRCAQRADGPAAVLGIGTANPAFCVLQDEFRRLLFPCHQEGAPHRPQRHMQDTMYVLPLLEDYSLPRVANT